MRISDWSSDVCSSDLKFHIGDSLQRHGVTGSGGHRQILNVGQIFAALLSNGHTDGNLPVRERDRKSAVEGKSGSVRVDLGGSRSIKKKTKRKTKKYKHQ